jgi:hypothetical protein
VGMARSFYLLLACGFGGGFVAVVFDVVLGGFGGVMGGVYLMAVGRVGVVCGCFVVASFVMLRGGAVMSRGVFMMLGGFGVVLGGLLAHVDFLSN